MIRVTEKIYTICIVLLIITGMLKCSRKVTKQTMLPKPDTLSHLEYTADTTHYVIRFNSKQDLSSFQKKFEELLDTYTIDPLYRDTIDNYFSLRIIPRTEHEQKMSVDQSAHDSAVIPFAPFTETDIPFVDTVPDTSYYEEEIVIPQGGTVSLFTFRSVLDNTLSRLYQTKVLVANQLSSFDFSPDTMKTHFLTITESGANAFHITLENDFRNSDGKELTAFDFVQSWTDFVSSHPALGYALFFPVKGIVRFIQGYEAIIPGFSVKDERSVLVLCEQMQMPSDALYRLTSPYLFPESLRLGPFSITSKDEHMVVMEKNPYYPGEQPYIDKYIVFLNHDRNPIVSFSLGKYDVVILYKSNDITYAEQNLNDKAKLLPFAEDRYFLSIAAESLPLRRYLTAVIDPQEIKNNAVKAKGTSIDRIDPQAILVGKNPEEKPLKRPYLQQPLDIVYNTGDPVSVSIAENIFSKLTHQGIACNLKGLMGTLFESTLVSRDYDIAIGWISNTELSDPGSLIHLATMWFDNIDNEQLRIDQCYELPLFTIKQFALCKNTVHLDKDDFRKIYIARP